jgi:hypothetical protein
MPMPNSSSATIGNCACCARGLAASFATAASVWPSQCLGMEHELTARGAGIGGDVILTAVGHNLRLVLAWLSSLLRFILLALCRAISVAPALKWAS